MKGEDSDVLEYLRAVYQTGATGPAGSVTFEQFLTRLPDLSDQQMEDLAVMSGTMAGINLLAFFSGGPLTAAGTAAITRPGAIVISTTCLYDSFRDYYTGDRSNGDKARFVSNVGLTIGGFFSPAFGLIVASPVQVADSRGWLDSYWQMFNQK